MGATFAQNVTISVNATQNKRLISPYIMEEMKTLTALRNCGRPSGIFKSSDKGKTWKLILPSVDDKIFNLSASGNVIYAIPRPGGC